MTEIPPLRLDLPFYSVTELATACNVGRSTVQRWLSSGKLDYDATVVQRPAFTKKAAEDFNRRIWTQRAERGRWSS